MWRDSALSCALLLGTEGNCPFPWILMSTMAIAPRSYRSVQEAIYPHSEK